MVAALRTVACLAAVCACAGFQQLATPTARVQGRMHLGLEQGSSSSSAAAHKVPVARWVAAAPAVAAGVAATPSAALAMESAPSTTLLAAGGLKDALIEFTGGPYILLVPVVFGFLLATAVAGLIYALSQPAEKE